LARRLLDLAEQTDQNLAMILLDWEKAFDKINQNKLIEALERLKVPPRMLKYIKMIYESPKFAVKTGDIKSKYHQQHTGIRQGCPLSPYLFILVMTIMFKDIKSRLNTPAQKQPIYGINFAEILYADDTLLFGKTTQVINKLLKEIQIESEYYNMKLNYAKCINITINRKISRISYMNKEEVPRKQKAVYLGTILTDTNDNHSEINNRISDCIITANRMKLFWNKAKTTIKWKLQVFDAMIRSKLLYGLETIQLTQNEKLRLDAFQMKGIRRLLQIPPTHIDRTWTNELVMKRANEEKLKPNKENDAQKVNKKTIDKPIIKFTEMWTRLRFKLLGHLLRTHHEDPLHEITFENAIKTPRLPIKRRIGRPRDQWIVETMKEAYEHIMLKEEKVDPTSYTPFHPTDREKIKKLVQTAENREHIFATKPHKFNRNTFITTNAKLDSAPQFVSEANPYNLPEESNLILPAEYYHFA